MKPTRSFLLALLITCSQLLHSQLTHEAYEERLLSDGESIATLFEYYLVDNYDSLVYYKIQDVVNASEDEEVKFKGELITVFKLVWDRKFEEAKNLLNQLPSSYSSSSNESQVLYYRARHWINARQGNRDSSAFYLNKALEFEDTNDLTYVSTALSLITTYLRRGQLDEGLNLIKEIQPTTLRMIEKDSSFLSLSKYGETYYMEGVVYFYKGQYGTAQPLLLKALSILELVENDGFIGAVNGLLAACYGSLKQYDLSLELHQKEIRRLKKKAELAGGLGISFENLANTYLEMQEFQKAFQHYDSALFYSPSQSRTAHIYNNMGIAHFRKQEYSQAAEYYQKAFDLRGGFSNTNKMNLGSSLINLGGSYMEAGVYQTAEEYLLKGLEISLETGLRQQQRSAYDLLGDLYEKLNDYEKSYNYLKQGNIIKDSLYQTEIQESIAEMQTKYDTEKKEVEILRQESQIQILEKNKVLAQSRLVILIGGFILLAIIGTLLYKRQQTQKALIKAELELVQSREDLLRKDIEYKNQELVNFAVQITQKNEFIESLNYQLSEIKKTDPEKKHLKEVEEILKANASISKDREEFDNYVQNVCEGFFTRLDTAFPEISQNDKKLAALIRLNLSSKEISTVLNISPKSVDMSRYRLRKKMKLDSSANLTEVLESI